MSWMSKLFGTEKKSENAHPKVDPLQKKRELAASMISLINSFRQLSGESPVSESEGPIWEKILMEAPENVLRMPFDGKHTSMDVDQYVKDEIRRNPDKYK